jgi:hypothetical protein
MKRYYYKYATLSVAMAFILLSLTACRVSGSLVGLTAAPELAGASQLSVSTGEEDAAWEDHSPNSLSETSASDLESRLIELYQEANPSVVYIITSTGSGK